MNRIFCDRCGHEMNSGERKSLSESRTVPIGHLRGAIDSQGAAMEVRSEITVKFIYNKGTSTVPAQVCQECREEMILQAILLNPLTREMAVALLDSRQAGTRTTNATVECQGSVL